MALMRRSGWPTFGSSLLSDILDDDGFFSSPSLRGQSIPAVNVREHENNYELEVAAPGFDKKDFQISIDNRQLTIAGEKKTEEQEKEEHYTRREFGYASFSRTFTLPENVQEENIQARYENGVLRILLGKRQLTHSKAKKPIEIK
jgi:HSP20 family protein